MKHQNAASTITIPVEETAQAPKKLTLMDFAEVFLTLPESSKHEVLGYAKCLYASEGAAGGRTQIAN